MHRKKIEVRLAKAIKSQNICKVWMADMEESLRLIPVKVSDDLILAAREEECQINGFTIRNKDEIEKVKIEDSVASSISMKEILNEKTEKPDINIENWNTVFESFANYGAVVIVEKKGRSAKHKDIAIGKVVKATKKNVFLKYYGPDGLYDQDSWKISYDDVESVVVGSRYANVFAKYLEEREEKGLVDDSISDIEE